MAVPSQIAAEVRITGRVQGVWFRGWTRQEAQRLGLVGWVRNEPDGSVRAHFQGTEGAVTRMLALCRQGPRMAQVTDVASHAASVDPAMTAFSEIR